MKHIPFPNSHEGDDFNRWMDGHVAGNQTQPANEVESAATELHALANTARNVHPGGHARQSRGDRVMHTHAHTAPSAPISNRTRREQQAMPTSNFTRWMSATLVAAMLIGVVGFAWLNGPGGGDRDDNLAYAPQVASPMAEEPLNPTDDQWIADFLREDCTLPPQTIRNNTDLNKTASSDPQGYAVVGPAKSGAAADAANQYREMRGCRNMSGAFSYFSDARIAEAPRVLNEGNRAELAEMQEYFGTVYPQQFMAVAEGVQVDNDVQQEWDARSKLGLPGQPIPLEAKLNPEWAVELSDGRIAFPATVIYAANDPAIVANGLPEAYPDTTVAIVFTMEDGSWKYDDSLPLCLVNCESGIGNPLDPVAESWIRQPDATSCTVEPITSDEYRARTQSMPEFRDRSYVTAGSADPDDAAAAVGAVNMWFDCWEAGNTFASSAIMTDLGLLTDTSGRFPDRNALAPYLRQNELGGRDLLLANPQWRHAAVIDGPVERVIPEGATLVPQIPGDSQNIAATRVIQFPLDPGKAIELGDGRIALSPTILVSITDRGAITYEGDSDSGLNSIWVMKEDNGSWLIDELLSPARPTEFVQQSPSWWWEPQYDATPVATPRD